MSKKRTPNDGLHLAIEAVGTRYRLAKLLGITPTSVLKWDHIPTARIIDVERVTGVDRADLRPDLYAR
jgi:DNA-binding transcriptional regulator YdaS (Cro superfamily)